MVLHEEQTDNCKEQTGGYIGVIDKYNNFDIHYSVSNDEWVYKKIRKSIIRAVMLSDVDELKYIVEMLYSREVSYGDVEVLHKELLKGTRVQVDRYLRQYIAYGKYGFTPRISKLIKP